MKRLIDFLTRQRLLRRAEARFEEGDYAGAIAAVEAYALRIGDHIAGPRMPAEANFITLQSACWIGDAGLAKAAAQALTTQVGEAFERKPSIRTRYGVSYLRTLLDQAKDAFPNETVFFGMLAHNLSRRLDRRADRAG